MAHDRALQGIIGRATQLLPYAVIKLRAECNNAPLLIAGGFPAPRVMFVLRDPVDWAVSVRRVTGVNHGAIAALLRSLLVGLDSLTRHYEVRLCYYEDFKDLGAAYVNELLAWMESDARITAETASELARKDAQEGSIVARAPAGDAQEDAAFREAFRAEWRIARPASLIERLGLRGL